MNADRFVERERLAPEQVTPLLLELEAFLHRRISANRHDDTLLTVSSREDLLKQDESLYWAICEYLYRHPPERRVA